MSVHGMSVCHFLSFRFDLFNFWSSLLVFQYIVVLDSYMIVTVTGSLTYFPEFDFSMPAWCLMTDSHGHGHGIFILPGTIWRVPI
jgi:hypothetical protein